MTNVHQSPLALSQDHRSPHITEPHIAECQSTLQRLESIEGKYLREYISESEETALLSHIDRAPWMTDLKRRVQHYGYRYDYRERKISQDMRIGDLPSWVMPLAERLGEDFFGKMPEQMIVNEYQPGQGIASHVDCEPCFGPLLVSVSMGSTCVMNLMKSATAAESLCRVADAKMEPSDRVDLFLEPRSAVILAGASRYDWTHGIAPRKNDIISAHKYPRARRVSLTFRSVIL